MAVDTGMLSAELEELTDALNRDIKTNAFNNNAVVWLVKAWSKIGILVGPKNYHKILVNYCLMPNDPSPLTGNSKRETVLKVAIETYEQAFENNGTTNGDFFQGSQRALLDFVWDWRKKTAGPKGQEFTRMLQDFLNLSPDQVAVTPVFNVERH